MVCREARRDGFSRPVPHLDRFDWDVRGVIEVANAKQSAGGHGRCGVNRVSNSRDDLPLTSANLSRTSILSRFSQRPEILSYSSRRPRGSPWTLPRGQLLGRT